MDWWKNTWQKSFYVPGYRLGLHILFWILYFAAFSVLTFKITSLMGWKGDELATVFVIDLALNIVVVIISYYLTLFTAYRALAVRQRYGLFFVFLILNIFVFCNMLLGAKALQVSLYGACGISDIPKSIKHMAFFKDGYWDTMTSILPLMQMMISYFALLCIPVTSKFFRDQLRTQKLGNELEKKNLQLQVDFVKAQIHPHFLFNTLNNIYSLSTKGESKKASEMVSGLSSLLHYALYKGKDEFISLKSELEMIREFIELQAIRSDDLELNAEYPHDLDPNIFLPPFLLLPLVENAFKHGVNSQLDQSWIKVVLSVSDERIHLKVSNSFDRDYRKKNPGGLGLVSLRKRLAYYYPHAFSLKTEECDNQFTASLKLPILCPKSKL